MFIHLFRLVTSVIPAMFPIITVMIEVPAMEISLVFPFKSGMVVLIIYLVAIVTMPLWIRVISVTGISLSKINRNMDLSRSRTCCNKAPDDDHG